MEKGKLIIFSAPSGAGKTTLVKHLLEINPNLSFSISCATREKRTNETHGKDYYFLSVDEFNQKIDEQAFVEWEEVYPNHFYGTLRSEIERIWNEGKHVVFDIDVKGGLKLKEIFGDRALAIFVQPPTLDELAKRLTARNTDSPEKLRMRIEKATDELAFADQFDQILINDNLHDAKSEMDFDNSASSSSEAIKSMMSKSSAACSINTFLPLMSASKTPSAILVMVSIPWVRLHLIELSNSLRSWGFLPSSE